MKLLRNILLSAWWTHGGVSASKSTGSSVRREFVARMEGATSSSTKTRNSHLTEKLLAMATPLDALADAATPRFLEDNQDFGINITEYALRYIGCQNVHQYSDDLAEDADSDTVLGMNRFVIVRLCPKGECSNYHHYGCNSGYGDYLIPMEDYLETMAADYFMEYQEYCETCYYCMKQSSAQGQQDNDAAYYNATDTDDAAADDANNGGRLLETTDDYYYKGADFYNNMNDDANDDDCANYYGVCNDFRTACKDYSQYATNMESYFQCSEFDVGGNVGYLGPHCRSDGKTIGIGLYKDQNCNEYNSDMTNLGSLLGMDVGDENLKAYYSERCISCLASEGYDLDQDGDDEATTICGTLYDMSAKCNKYMGSKGNYSSYAQEKSENDVCTFISNLITNSYDEYGHIYLENDGWQAINRMISATKFQKYALSFSILLATALLGYSCYLHRRISSLKFAWYPRGRRGYSHSTVPGQPSVMQRMHSGIIQGRSRSGGPELAEGGGVYA